jgi:hypothetical protein|tara:strand:- start:3593 stop:3865 length:273 start_codon:yes stop_codon:yes gene_type:complete
MSKQTGLAAFTNRKAATVAPPVTIVADVDTTEPAARKRGKGEVVALTVRLSRAEWERVHQLAVAEGTSIQQLALKGLSKVFAEKGLPGIA